MAKETDLRIETIGTTRSKLAETLELLDATAQRINRGDGGREVALAKTKLQEADYWLREAATIIANNRD